MELWIILILSFFVASHYSANSERVFNDEQSYLNFEDGSKDVLTNLDLSPWELFVITDLSFKLTSLQCPQIDESILFWYKDYITDSLKPVTSSSEAQHSNFMSVYNTFVKCLDDFYKRKGITESEVDEGEEDAGKLKSNVMTKLIEDSVSSEVDWIAKDGILTSSEKPASAPVTPNPELNSTGGLSLMRELFNWIKRITKLTTSEAKTTSSEEAPSKLKVDLQKQRQLELYRKARQNFVNVFHGMSKIIKKTCPVPYRPEKVFLRKAFLDITTWATLNKHETTKVSEQIFGNFKLLKKINECYKKL